MLPAQVSYWNLQEQKRHNLATEELTAQEIAEKVRHNQADERVRIGTLEEQKRNNLYVNQQGDYSLGLNAQDTATRKFSAVKQAEIGIMNARAATTQAGAAMLNAGTNAAIGDSTIALNTIKGEQAELSGAAERRRTNAQTDLIKSQTQTESSKQGQLDAQAGYTQKQTEYVDFYAGDRAKQTDIQQQRAYNEMGGKILDNLTPWN